jgi:hypothetical protein
MAVAKKGWLKLLWIGVGGVVVLVILNWQTLALTLALVLNAHDNRPPVAIGVHDWGKAEFTSRLVREFPIGTPELQVIGTLRSQRFTVDPDKRSATFSGGDGVCNVNYDLRWSADTRGRLMWIEGDRIEAGCL